MAGVRRRDALMLLVWVAIVAVTTSAASCPCARPELCLPVRGPPASREVLAFSVGDHRGWDVFLKHVTTIALFGPPNITMLCAAHQRGVRVVSSGSLPLEQLLNSTARDEFVATSVAFAVGNHLDGFNLDFESPISTSEEQRALNDLFRDLRDAFRRSVSPNAQITLDIGMWRRCDSRHRSRVAQLGHPMISTGAPTTTSRS